MAARGNKVIISSPEVGRRVAGVLSGTPKPGTCMEIQTPFYQQGNHLYRVYQPGTDGDRRPVIVLLEDDLQGFVLGTAGVDGTMRQFYYPVSGEEMNMLIADVAGTADDHAALEVMIIDTGTGKLIATTGSPESEPFILLEAATDPTADYYAPCLFTGY